MSNECLKGVSVSSNKLSDTFISKLFYSQENIDKFQGMLRYLVHKNTKEVIDLQPVDAIKSYMTSIYDTYARHPIDITPDMTPEQKDYLIKSYKSEIIRLNELLMRKILPLTVSNLQQFKDYIKEVEQGQLIPEYAKNVSTVGTKSIEFSQI